MPISVPGTFSRRGVIPPRSCGFTLLELLVVLLVMGLCAGLVGALARPDERTLLRFEAERLAQLLDLAAEEARLSGRPIAWSVESAQYRFWRWREEAGWSEVQEDSLRARSLRPGLSISELRVEALRSTGGLRLEFNPHGALAYDFQMSLGAARYTVAGSPLGQVSIHASP
jgi:general secretion pathway protein H